MSRRWITLLRSNLPKIYPTNENRSDIFLIYPLLNLILVFLTGVTDAVDRSRNCCGIPSMGFPLGVMSLPGVMHKSRGPPGSIGPM